MNEKTRLKALIVEDSPDDAALLIHHLQTVGGFDVEYTRVQTAETMRAELANHSWEIILSDYSMPQLTAPEALAIFTSFGLDIPFIVITATIGEEKAVALMKAGAHDFILKGNFQRLVPAIERELREANNRKHKREIESERTRLLEELRELVRIRDEFLSLASHELMTPLTPIRLGNEALRMILNKPLDDHLLEKARMTVATSRGQIERLVQLARQLLDVSRLRAGKLKLEISSGDLSQVVRESAEQYKNRARDAGCTLEFDLPESCVGSFDGPRVGGVILNLLSNAIKYGPGKPIRIALRREGSGPVRLIVQDFGMGIDPKDQSRIFERFERAVDVHHYGGGLGLGLYLSRQVALAHGGKLTLDSTPGQGSTFTVELPC